MVCMICRSLIYVIFFIMKLYATVQWMHKIAKANSIICPGYKDKLYLTKLFLNILILGNEAMEYGKLFQIATACEKKEK